MSARRSDQALRQRLLHERDALIRQREAIDNEIKGIEKAISLVGAESGAPQVRPQVKTVVLDLLEEVKGDGIDAASAVSMAFARGISLDRGSVSSLLSRMKRDEVITYSEGRYRLKKYSGSAFPPLPPMPRSFN